MPREQEWKLMEISLSGALERVATHSTDNFGPHHTKRYKMINESGKLRNA